MLIDPAIAQQLQLLLKVALAMLLGSVVGLEREARDQLVGVPADDPRGRGSRAKPKM